jgi:hypothetical protein
MDSEFWEFEPLVGDFQSPSILLLHLNVFTALSLFRVRGTRPDFRIPPQHKWHSCFRRYFVDLVFLLDIDSEPRFQPPVTAIQASFGHPVYTFSTGPSILFNRCFA